MFTHNDSLVRWIAGFGAATPLAAQAIQQPSTPWWSLLLLPVLAALGNVLAGVVMEALKLLMAWLRAKTRAEIKELGENPDDPQISAPIAGKNRLEADTRTPDQQG